VGAMTVLNPEGGWVAETAVAAIVGTAIRSGCASRAAKGVATASARSSCWPPVRPHRARRVDRRARGRRLGVAGINGRSRGLPAAGGRPRPAGPPDAASASAGRSVLIIVRHQANIRQRHRRHGAEDRQEGLMRVSVFAPAPGGPRSPSAGASWPPAAPVAREARGCSRGSTATTQPLFLSDLTSIRGGGGQRPGPPWRVLRDLGLGRPGAAQPAGDGGAAAQVRAPPSWCVVQGPRDREPGRMDENRTRRPGRSPERFCCLSARPSQRGPARRSLGPVLACPSSRLPPASRASFDYHLRLYAGTDLIGVALAGGSRT